MTEELPPTPDETPEEKETRNRALALDKLPPEVRARFDSLISQGKSYREIAYSLKLEFKGKNTELDTLLDSSDHAYRNYVEKHEERIMKLAADTQLITTDLKVGLADVKVAIDAMTDPSSALENKKQALVSLHDHCAARLRLLEARQGLKFLDPQYEQLILAFIREQRGIVESLVSLQDELKKDGVNEFYKEFKSYTYTLLVTFNQVYKELWGDEKFIDFHQELEKRMGAVLDRWLQDRNVTLPPSPNEPPKA
jgi:hypothetical protein